MIARLIGWSIEAVLMVVLASPLIVGVLIWTGRVRYRGWLACTAFAASLASFSLSGDYLYNLLHWTQSRPSLPTAVFTLTLLMVSPLFLMAVILKHVQKKAVWAAGLVLLSGFVVFKVRGQYAARALRDQQAYERGMTQIQPSSDTVFVTALREYRKNNEIVLQGHIAEGAPVRLLSDPFAHSFKPQVCTARAAAYIPAAKDPAALGHVTLLDSLAGCDPDGVYSVAVVGPAARDYQMRTFEKLDAVIQTQAKNLFTDKVIRRNVFTLNGQTYIAAITEKPSAPGLDVMNPDWTYWLLRVDASNLIQIWPTR